MKFQYNKTGFNPGSDSPKIVAFITITRKTNQSINQTKQIFNTLQHQPIHKVCREDWWQVILVFEGKMIYLVYLVEGKEVQIMKIIITREYHYNSLIGKM